MTIVTESLFSDPKVDQIVEALREVDGWPADPVADERYARRLVAEFPTVDVVDAIQQWQCWMDDNRRNIKGKINWRSRLRTWLKNGMRWDRERREESGARTYRSGAGATRNGDRGQDTRARRNDTYGPTRRLDDF